MSCQTPQEEELGGQRVKLPVSICLPVEETYTQPNGGPRRVMGDPGTTETFLLPNYVYIIVMRQDASDASVWTPWHIEERTVVDGDWTKRRYTGLLQTAGDSIYEYNKEIDLLLSNEKFNGRVYAIASAVALSFNKNPLNTIENMSDVETLTFNSGADGVQANLQHIYTTPFTCEVDDKYYGSFSSKNAKVPHVNLLLYHVAAKVDIKWNVAEEKRINTANPSSAVRLTYMKACNLFNDYAFCFKPMANTLATKVTPAAGKGDTITFIRPEDEGLWWEGRSYFYTIPYTLTSGDYQSHFPLQMMMATNDSTKYYKPTILLQVDKTSSFVPWLRATFNLSNPLTEKTENKVVAL